MKSKTEPAHVPSWITLIVVCKDCQKRSSGPKRLKTKEAIGELRSALKTERPRPRVVATSCLGLCPKRALAIARVGGPGEARIGAAERLEEVAAVSQLLLAGAV